MKKVEARGCKYFDWVGEPFDSRLSGVLCYLVKSKTLADEMAVRLDAQVKELTSDLDSMIIANDNVIQHSKMLEEKIRILESENEEVTRRSSY